MFSNSSVQEIDSVAVKKKRKPKSPQLYTNLTCGCPWQPHSFLPCMLEEEAHSSHYAASLKYIFTTMGNFKTSKYIYIYISTLHVTLNGSGIQKGTSMCW